MASLIEAVRAAAVKPRQVRLGVSIPDDLVVFVKQVAQEAGVTQSDVVTFALRLHRERAEAASPATGEGLDVERLRAAIYAVSVRHDWEHTTDREDRTEEIAAEYARLAATPAPAVTGPQRVPRFDMDQDDSQEPPETWRDEDIDRALRRGEPLSSYQRARILERLTPSSTATAGLAKWHHSPDAPPEHFCEDCDSLVRRLGVEILRAERAEAALAASPVTATPELDPERLFAAAHKVWPRHTEGSMSQPPSPTDTTWDVLDPAAYSKHLIEAIAAAYLAIAEKEAGQ